MSDTVLVSGALVITETRASRSLHSIGGERTLEADKFSREASNPWLGDNSAFTAQERSQPKTKRCAGVSQRNGRAWRPT